jgi:uncharacterized protein YcbK (DUF882 family)
LIDRWKKTAASAAIAALIGTGLFMNWNSPAVSGGETRTVSLYHVHTKESITITYMKDGKYIPSAMKKLNYFLRDWRRNETITISPRTIDLMWELHADLGSKAPIHIVCGYRSPKTNAFLKKVGRNVARKSQHMVGHAIDLYFPDVPTVKIRNSALVRQVGGVGYYRSGAGPTGFLHIDSGNVRHWGPAISQRQMAQIMRDYRKTVGARLNKKGMKAVPEVEVAEADATAVNLPSQQEGGAAASAKPRKKIPLETAYTDDDEELAGMSQDASVPAPKKPKARPDTLQKQEAPEETQDAPEQPQLVAEAPEGVTKGYPVPKPRPKPIEVLMMAAVNLKIEPASAPPPDQMARQKPTPLASNAIGVVEAAETMAEPESNVAAKTSLAEELRNGESKDVPVIRTMTTASAGGDVFWWPQQVIFDSNKAVRRDGAPQQFTESPLGDLLPGGVRSAEAEPVVQTPRLAVAEMAPAPSSEGPSSEGKGDMLVVNREGKGSLLSIAARPRTAQNDLQN